MDEESRFLPSTIVVIDDDYVMRISCLKILQKSGYRVEIFEDGASGLKGVQQIHPDLLVVDLKMPGISGMEVIDRVHEFDPNIVIVVITGYATINTAVEAMKCGAYDFLPKPFSPDEMRLIVERGLERRRLVLEAQRLEIERELLKRRFVTFVAHQVQTPLVAIKQYLDVMKHLGSSVDSMRDEWLSRCLERTEEVIRLTKSWLAPARVERGCLSGEKSEIELKGIIVGLIKAYENSAEAAGVSLEANLPEHECWVMGDRTCCVVLVENLITNAIKYNKPGGKVTVGAALRDGKIEIAVSDTGIGISPEHQEKIFNEFYRVTEGVERKSGGSGLGLAICKRILTEMDGRIEVESEPGRGSTFRFWLPAMSRPGGSAEGTKSGVDREEGNAG